MDDEWQTIANDAITVSLVRPGAAGIDKITSFNPKFTYAMFQEEYIIGYQGLKIQLQYDARDLRPNLAVSYSKKNDAVLSIESFDVKEVLKEFLPGVAFQSRSTYEDAVKNLPEPWSPPGTLVKSVEKNGGTYEIWKGDLSDLAVKQMLRRIQFTVLLFIEGGSYIGIDENGNDEPESSLARWSVFFIYKKESAPNATDKTQYVFQGFSTVYDFWLFQQSTPPSSPRDSSAPIEPKVDDSWELPAGDFPFADFPKRQRISQFIILPPFQGKGVGALLYSTIFELYHAQASVKEITVEDPNEDFDLLRDLCDLKYLRKNIPGFAALKVNRNLFIPEKGGTLHDDTHISLANASTSSELGIVDASKLEEMRIQSKIAPRQFHRLVEMHLMSTLPASVRPSADISEEPSMKPPAPKDAIKAYTLWRLLLKQRLYRRNVLVLAELETTERIIKLNETVSNVEWEYARILERAEPEAAATNGKRKIDSDAETDTPSSKKVRVEDA